MEDGPVDFLALAESSRDGFWASLLTPLGLSLCYWGGMAAIAAVAFLALVAVPSLPIGKLTLCALVVAAIWTLGFDVLRNRPAR